MRLNLQWQWVFTSALQSSEASHWVAQKSWILVHCSPGVESQSVSFGQVVGASAFPPTKWSPNTYLKDLSRTQ